MVQIIVDIHVLNSQLEVPLLLLLGHYEVELSDGHKDELRTPAAATDD